ncbi:MAG: ATP-grasp domain-containing protein [Rhodocyclaceae bacterium]
MTISPTPLLVLAALSARALAHSARTGGFTPVALDVFGDLDTRQIGEWRGISGGGLVLDGAALVSALQALRNRPGFVGWMAGSGFEACPDVLAAAAKVVAPLGNPPELVAQVRTPRAFFALLRALSVPHPETCFIPPEHPAGRPIVPPAGWLVKNAHACGGWHVRALTQASLRDIGWPAVCGDAATATAPGAWYFQRRTQGMPLSALFLADGARARVLGIARQSMRSRGRRPFVYYGGIGPVRVPGACAAWVEQVVARLVVALGLVGLNGIDFLLDEAGDAWLLELNPRPTASLALFDDAVPGGLVRAHVAACRIGALPPPPTIVASSAVVRGFETVYANRPVDIDKEQAACLLAQPECCDIPQPGTRLSSGDPVCTVRAEGENEGVVVERLAAQARRVREVLNGATGWADGGRSNQTMRLSAAAHAGKRQR